MSFSVILSFLISLVLSFLGSFIPYPTIVGNPPLTATSSPVASLEPTATTTIAKRATTTPARKTPPAKSVASLPTVPLATPGTPSIPVVPPLSTAELNARTRPALVNIFCTTKRDGELRPITASGVIISPDGVVLTNAHAAQYYLLRNYREPGFIDCILRTGSPAKAAYRAELLYLSPAWLRENKSMIRAEKQLGTGENDFALLLITSSIDGSPLPSSFSYLPLSTEDKDIMDHPLANYLVAGYPAGFLGGSAIVSDLYQTSTVDRVSQIYTFRDDTADLIAFGGSLLAQRGASGGAAVSEYGGKAAGIIVTTTEAKATGDRDLHVVTGSHINRSFLADMDTSLNNFLAGDLKAALRNFRLYTEPDLIAELTAALTK